MSDVSKVSLEEHKHKSIVNLTDASGGWESLIDDELHQSSCSILRQAGSPSAFASDELEMWMQECVAGAKWDSFGNIACREVAWYTDSGCECEYSYSRTSWKPHDPPDWLTRIRSQVMRRCEPALRQAGLRGPPNSVNINYYRDGSNSVKNWHADAEELFDAENRPALIISFSLGATRTFEMMPSPHHAAWEKYNVPVVTDLCAGDILVMEGFFQRFYWHRAPQAVSANDDVGPRINFTWRWITKHGGQCPLSEKKEDASLSDQIESSNKNGLSFSDRHSDYWTTLLEDNAPKSFLILGDGDLSFSLALARELRTRDLLPSCKVVCTCLQSKADLVSMFPNAGSIIEELEVEFGCTVQFEVDATALERSFEPDEHFERIVFNFPYNYEVVERGQKIHQQRALLHGTFSSCRNWLTRGSRSHINSSSHRGDGSLWISLCEAQGGTAADSISKKASRSWRIDREAAACSLAISAICRFPDEHLEKLGYRPRGSPNNDMEFNIKNSVQYVFSNCDSESDAANHADDASPDQKMQRIVVPVVFRSQLRMMLLNPISWKEDAFGETVQNFGEQHTPRLRVEVSLRNVKRRKHERQLRTYDVKFCSHEQLFSDERASAFVRDLSVHLNRTKSRFSVEIVSLKLVSNVH